MYKNDLLKTLHQNKKDYVSGDQLIAEVGIPKTQLEEKIQTLIKEGYEIEVSENGYRLLKEPNILLPHEIQKNLQTKYIGHEIHHYHEVGSTNTVPKNWPERVLLRELLL